MVKLPISQRKKQGLKVMAQWIATTKLIVATEMNSGQRIIQQCIIRHVRDDYKQKKDREKTRLNHMTASN